MFDLLIEIHSFSFEFDLTEMFYHELLISILIETISVRCNREISHQTLANDLCLKIRENFFARKKNQESKLILKPQEQKMTSRKILKYLLYTSSVKDS